MKKTVLLAGVASVAILAAGGASAFGDNPYFAASGGFNLLGPISVTPNPGTTGYDRTFDFNVGVAGSLAIGHHFSDVFRGEAELSYRYNGLKAVTVQNEGAQSFNSGSAKSFGVMANGWFDIPTGGVIRPYVGGGVGVAHLRLRADTIGGTTPAPSNDIGLDFDGSGWVFAYQLGAGAAVPLGSSGAELTFDYRYFHAGGIDVPWTGSGSGTGKSTDYSAHSGMIGIRMPIGNLLSGM